MDLLNAEEREVRDIFGRKETQYIIPRNQREYVWEEKQWKEFWVDVIDCIELKDGEYTNKNYFIGSCVLIKEKRLHRSIVDGQQRLTTITIILSALYDVLKGLNQDQYLEGIYSYIYKKSDDGEEYFIIKNDDIEPFYSESILNKSEDKEYIQPSSEQEKRISKCYNYFLDLFNEQIEKNGIEEGIKYLIAFRNQLLSLKIIEISVNDEIDAYTIFEILNAKGKQLELGDRMKNWILKKLPKTFPTDSAKEKWNKLRDHLESVSKSENIFISFVNHYWISKYEKLKDDDEIYHYFKINIRQDKMIDFLTDLERNAEYYSEIVVNNRTELLTELNFILNSFWVFRTVQVRPILLSLFHNYKTGIITEKELISYLRRLENFHFVFSAICSSAANKIEKIYYDYAPQIRHSFTKSLMNDFFDELEQKKPDYESFRRNFITKCYSTKNPTYKTNRILINYILQRIEYYKQGNREFSINDISIEHILSDDGTEKTCQIGNLLPLAQSINENCENDALSLKLPKYANSNYKTVSDFIKYHGNKTEWSEQNIKDRTDRICQLAYNKVWTN